MFDRLRFKIEELSRYVEVLELYRYTSLEDLENDPDLRNSAENSMQVAADCTLDIADAILREQGVEEKADYMERISSLSDINVLDEVLAQKLAATADYWDVLLRHRTKVDISETYRHIQSISDDLREFLHYVGEYAESDMEEREGEMAEEDGSEEAVREEECASDGIEAHEGGEPDEEELPERELVQDADVCPGEMD